MTETTLEGGCHCGDVRYEIKPADSKLVVCHCTGCQKQSSSAFGLTMIVPSDAVSVLGGDLKMWTRTTDSGNIQDTFHCSTCGSRIFHGNKDKEDSVKVRVGTLDTSVDIATAVHIWTDSKLPGVVVPEGVKSFPQNPG